MSALNLKFLFIVTFCVLANTVFSQIQKNYEQAVPGRWTEEKINEWYSNQPWLVGCNYYPATAINQIEMWQASTWDPETINKELSWAAGLGMNTLRVYLHDLVWADDEEGFYSRIDEFLSICHKYGIRPFFVFFDDCHYPEPKLGEQPLPVKGWHNSGWRNCPARDVALRYADGKATNAEIAQLKGYVQKTMKYFSNDSRVLMWELYNEPGRGNGENGDMGNTSGSKQSIGDKSNKLVYDSWVWAREVNPSQPIMSNSAGSVGKLNTLINRVNSDLHSIHSYSPPAKLRMLINDYQKDGRPVIVTEWLARTNGSTVADCLPVLKEMNVGAINWGLVSGKSGTIWPWSSRRANGKSLNLNAKRIAGEVVKYGEPFPEPELWFHDIYRIDGTPFDQKEIEVFQELTGAKEGWQSIETPIQTRWSKKVVPANAWKEYPRPQLVRKEWKNLNGLWDYTISPNSIENRPETWEGKILVPFSIEAPLSGVGRQITADDAIWYKRIVSIPEEWKDKKVMLHFEASDFETTAWLNGVKIGTHKGGYQPFSFAFDASFISDEAELLVKVNDPQGDVFRSIGKQGKDIQLYERCSGIWQTVWMEPVSKSASIRSLKIETTLKKVNILPTIDGNQTGLLVKYEIKDNGKLVKQGAVKAGEVINQEVPNAKIWNPNSPFLYDLTVTLVNEDKIVDRIDSYFGMRTIEIAQSPTGTDVLLNGNPVFQMGPLDQNYWPEGGLTPPSDAAMKWEAEYLKRIGCNMIRLHIKRNPRSFYHHCDKLGLLVWQDFVCGPFRMKKPKKEDSDFWFNEQKEMVEILYNHPSIVMWIVFNESWGQHDTERIFQQSRALDKTRLFSIASGWTDVPGLGDIKDIHDYTFRPSVVVPGADPRVVVLGECGGFASAVPPHNWLGRPNKSGSPTNPLYAGFDPEIPRDDNEKHDIFRPTFTAGEAFQNQYKSFVEHLHLLQSSGLRAAVYTQMSDMKREENGWLSFDREVSKIQPDSLHAIHSILYTSAPVQSVMVNSSKETPEKWNVAEMPIENIKKRAIEKNQLDAMAVQEENYFEKVKWHKKEGAFGNFPNMNINSDWDGKSQLLIKREFELNDVTSRLSIRIYTKLEGKGTPWMHSRIYLNGKFVADETTRQYNPELRMAEVILPESAYRYLNDGDNEIMIQFVPGLQLNNGKISPVSEKVFVDVEIMEIND